MKKMFLTSVMAVFAMGIAAGAWAQDSYDEEGYETSYSEESAPEEAPVEEAPAEENSDESYTMDESNSSSNSASEDVSDNSNDEKKASNDLSAPGLHFGVHFGAGLASTWGNEKALGIYDILDYGSDVTISEKDPYDGYLGFIIDIGFLVDYRINQYLGVNAELNARIVDYIKESDCWYIRVWDGWGYSNEPVDENMMLIDLNIPVLLRFYPTSKIYVEGGAEINVNLSSSFSLTNDDYDYDKDMGSAWKGETFGYGVVVGAGADVDVKGKPMEFGLRFVLDLSRIEADEIVDMIAANGTYREAVATKLWAIQFVWNYYIK